MICGKNAKLSTLQSFAVPEGKERDGKRRNKFNKQHYLNVMKNHNLLNPRTLFKNKIERNHKAYHNQIAENSDKDKILEKLCKVGGINTLHDKE